MQLARVALARRRLYASIPHLPGSRAAGDRTLAPTSKEARLCLSEESARHEVIIEEKLDGSCVAIVREGGVLVARGREGGRAAESRNDARRMFAAWVADKSARFEGVIDEGEALVGEWLALVHGTRYALVHEPFVAFDLLGVGRARATRDELAARVLSADLTLPALLHRGGPLSIADARALLGAHGRHGALDPPEGLVYRVEALAAGGAPRRVHAVAKWVRPDKVDGAYLPENTGREALYHWRMDERR